MIVYTCPRCGGDLEETLLTSYPPQHEVCCNNCGWTHVTREEIRKIPYPTTLDLVDAVHVDNIPNPCRNCSNHPSNGGSGVCLCTLGSQTVTC